MVEIGDVFSYRSNNIIFSVHIVIYLEDNLIYFADGRCITMSKIKSDEWRFLYNISDKLNKEVIGR